MGCQIVRGLRDSEVLELAPTPALHVGKKENDAGNTNAAVWRTNAWNPFSMR